VFFVIARQDLGPGCLVRDIRIKRRAYRHSDCSLSSSRPPHASDRAPAYVDFALVQSSVGLSNSQSGV
jgi:hypothetical protein